MPKGRSLNKDQVSKLLESFRTHPGNVSAAAKHAGVNKRTAEKAWHFGLRCTAGAERAFAEVLAEEQIETRARIEAERAAQAKKLAQDEAERKRLVAERARNDVTETRAQEAQMIRMARAGTVGLLATMATLSKGAMKLGEKVRQSMEAVSQQETLQPKQAADVMRVINGLSTAMKQANDAAQRAMEMERLLLGEPTSILGVQQFETLTMVEAEERIRAAAEALESAKRRGIRLDGDEPELLDVPPATPHGDPIH